MYVVATAGHVDHGKSTLVRALTGTDPDRWAEEKRRGLTIDLGFASTTTPSGVRVAFVDVPGHERFLGNMLAGFGPAPFVCFVVAADEGWRPQSGDHRDAVAALAIEHGVIVISRADLAAERVPEVAARIRQEFAGTGLQDAPIVPVSAVTGKGLPELLSVLEGALLATPKLLPGSRIRWWIDRAFSIKGAGTVVTGTLPAGTLRTGDRLLLVGDGRRQEVTIRGVQEHGRAVDSIGPVSRVALNLRSIGSDEIHRGDVLLTPGVWHLTDSIDVRRTSGRKLDETAAEVTIHLGTASVPARLRPFDAETGRLTLGRQLPITVGDRIILRDNTAAPIAAGVQVLDVDPPPLRRRGSGRQRAAQLAAANRAGDIRVELRRRGAVRDDMLRRMGIGMPDLPLEGVRAEGDWWLDEDAVRRWAAQLHAALLADRSRDPLSPGLSRKAAADACRLPDTELLDLVVREAGLALRGPAVTLPDESADLGPAEPGIAAVEARLHADSFAAPDADELTALGLGRRELAAAEHAGRLLRLADGIVLLPTAPALAMRELARLPGPFTVSQARTALGTTRRVAIPLLEHLDRRGWTRRAADGRREVIR
ncbi:selenocysteine-specific translation elongation factor [Flexivirga caeni]|uniref:Selenocysteine-specific elongation factor n=1 Tax=Flexivirga caeni TaxID=2294115 RepID=A0A3M9M675_9MICO|nr:selenocysteine-specific translation elongation factor [Flexivirga caeni]RNI20675.1 selenocysteine-specific translation elongation factor [Flexivirga caeni]